MFIQVTIKAPKDMQYRFHPPVSLVFNYFGNDKFDYSCCDTLNNVTMCQQRQGRRRPIANVDLKNATFLKI